MMKFRFEEENFQNVYVLEDYYCTNPFCDCNHVTISFHNPENDERISFLLNFNKTHSLLPNQPKPTKTQLDIIKGFIKNLQEELFVLLKQRYLEAKAHGEKNPMSYLVFETGRYVNYLEMFPKNAQTLDFSYEGERCFAEDSYDWDPRNNNKDMRLAFYKFDLKNDKQLPQFNYTYHFDEKLREEEDRKLEAKESSILMTLNLSIPNLHTIVKTRYKEAKELGQKLMEVKSKVEFAPGKINRNDECPCGSGKKYKKCCALKLN